jgi:hypothetical protein
MVWGAAAPVRGGRRCRSVLGLDRAAAIDGWEKDVAGLGGRSRRSGLGLDSGSENRGVTAVKRIATAVGEQRRATTVFGPRRSQSGK